MSTNFARYNDGSSNPPRLRVQHSLWSLRKLPLNAAVEWTLDEKFRRVKAAGFEAVECWLTDEDEQEHRDALDSHGLRLVLGHRPFTLEDVRKTVARAVRLRADYPLVQVQPVQRYVYSNDTLNRMAITPGPSELRPEHWAAYEASIVEPNVQRGDTHYRIPF